MDVKDFFTDESVIHLVTGESIKGAEAIGEMILECCKSYTKGYIKGYAIGVAGGLAIGGAAIFAVEFITRKVMEHKANKKEVQGSVNNAIEETT